MTVFEQCFAIVVGNEGGLTTNQADPGNWTGGKVGNGRCIGTRYGISAAAYPDVDIANLSLADAQAIYRRDYWARISGDALPAPLAMLTFDAAVNCGVGRAVGWLQEGVGVAADGAIGPQTLAAIGQATASGGAALCAEVLGRRIAFMAGLPTWHVFGLGWARRLARLPFQSLTITEPA